MNAGELYRAGQLQEAIKEQIQEVKANPADNARRLFLFELLAFSGDLERARKQVEAINYAQPELDLGVQALRKLLDAEQLRRGLLRDGLSPRFLLDPPEHVKLRLEAVNRLREGKPAEAAPLLERANEGAASLKGTLNGKAFEGMRDADDLFGTVLEVLAQGQYFWVPLEQVEAVALNAPAFPRDLIWMPARLALREGPEGEVFLPALYPGTHDHGDDATKLGRATDWNQSDGGPVLGVGLRTYLVGEEASNLPEWREVRLG